MNMNRYIYTLMAAVALLLGITACNEKLSMFEANQNPPEVTDFSPKNGVAGTEISITGANLQEVDSIKIGGQAYGGKAGKRGTGGPDPEDERT